MKNFIVKGHNVQQTLQNVTTVPFSVSYNEEKQQNLESENVWDDFCSKMTWWRFIIYSLLHLFSSLL